MYKLTTENKEKMLDIMRNELSNRNYTYNEEALETILNTWYKRKKKLLDVFSNHPLWNEEKCLIQFDTDYDREIDVSVVHNFYIYLRDNLIIKHKCHYSYMLPLEVTDIIDFFYEMKTTFIEENTYILNMVDYINRINDQFKIRQNMKCSKVIGKICRVMEWDKFPNFDKEYAKVCDALSPIKVKRHTCISLNPMDFLLMSNGNSWTSCHDIRINGDSGCYSSGGMSYMLDCQSFVFYTVDSEFNGTDIELEHKINRQMFAYNKMNLLQLRLYPQRNDSNKSSYTEIREIVQKVIADCISEPNLWVKQSDIKNIGIRKGRGGMCYGDWRSSPYVVTYHKNRNTKTTRSTFTLGRSPMRLENAREHTSGRFC